MIKKLKWLYWEITTFFGVLDWKQAVYDHELLSCFIYPFQCWKFALQEFFE